MNKRYFRILLVLIILGLPFAFFFYYKAKIDALPKQNEKVVDYGAAPFFKYADQNGDSISSDDLKGFIYVADFIFTNCGGVCPNLSKAMTDLQQNFVNQKQVKFVSFTVDPDRDSISVLKDYSMRYGADDNRWYFLRGEKHAVWDMAEKGFKVTVRYTPEGGTGSEFTHFEKMILVDGEGKIRGLYDWQTEQDSLNNNIARLIAASRSQQ